ncbi:MAG: hypothetical protein Q8K78_07800, partial [Planctomycetaceae bacterium]|nr:hypothetical protein [Planctomycetaceae bacterium]
PADRCRRDNTLRHLAADHDVARVELANSSSRGEILAAGPCCEATKSWRIDGPVSLGTWALGLRRMSAESHLPDLN